MRDREKDRDTHRRRQTDRREGQRQRRKKTERQSQRIRTTQNQSKDTGKNQVVMLWSEIIADHSGQRAATSFIAANKTTEP